MTDHEIIDSIRRFVETLGRTTEPGPEWDQFVVDPSFDDGVDTLVELGVDQWFLVYRADDREFKLDLNSPKFFDDLRDILAYDGAFA